MSTETATPTASVSVVKRDMATGLPVGLKKLPPMDDAPEAIRQAVEAHERARAAANEARRALNGTRRA